MNKISFSWNLLFKCNYRCPYCWFHGRWEEMSKFNRFPPFDKAVKSWRNIYQRYGSAHIDILGGEPFLYPDFAQLLKEISRFHSVGITTNFSCDIEKMIKDIDPSKVGILPTFHPAFADFDSFLKKALVLKKHKFGNSIAYLAYPPQMKEMAGYKKRLTEEGFYFSVMTFWGKYNGIDYPMGYTEEEKEILNSYLGERAGEKFQTTPKKVKGLRCRAGQSYAVIFPDGTTLRCGGVRERDSKLVMYNFFDENFKLLDAPFPCEAEYCPCNEWAFLLEEEGK